MAFPISTHIEVSRNTHPTFVVWIHAGHIRYRVVAGRYYLATRYPEPRSDRFTTVVNDDLFHALVRRALTTYHSMESRTIHAALQVHTSQDDAIINADAAQSPTTKD